jgi:dUTP pyrophosphatase
MAIVKIINGSGFPLPDYQTPGSAGVDLCAWIDRDLVLLPMQREIVPTGIFLEIPQGMEAQIRPRSGLAAKNGVTVLNTPGTIDSDYRGEIKVILINLSDRDFMIKNGDRIAQMVFAPYVQVEFDEVTELSNTQRGTGGFGHTGK